MQGVKFSNVPPLALSECSIAGYWLAANHDATSKPTGSIS
jgi:hypothetical protein